MPGHCKKGSTVSALSQGEACTQELKKCLATAKKGPPFNCSLGLLSSMAETFRTHDWRVLLRNTPGFVDDEQIDGGRHLKPISFSYTDLQLPFLHIRFTISQLETHLPYALDTMLAKDLSLLMKFSSMDSKLNIEDALKSELAAICVILFFTQVSPHVKEVAARTLSFIFLGYSKVTKMSVDERFVENLLVRILSSGNTELQRQVCKAIYFLAICPLSCVTVAFFGAGVQDVLLHLITNRSCNPALTYSIIQAVYSIGNNRNSNGMREKIIKAELLEPWLAKLWSEAEDDEHIMECACWTIDCIAREQCNSELWDHVKKNLLHLIFEGGSKTVLLKPAVCTIQHFSINGTPDQIDHLVNLGSLKYVINACSNAEADGGLMDACLDAFEAILKVKDANDEKADKMDMLNEDEEFEVEESEDEEKELRVDVVVNEYAQMIDFDDWDVLLLNHTRLNNAEPLVVKAERIVHKYQPYLYHVS